MHDTTQDHTAGLEQLQLLHLYFISLFQPVLPPLLHRTTLQGQALERGCVDGDRSKAQIQPIKTCPSCTHTAWCADAPDCVLHGECAALELLAHLQQLVCEGILQPLLRGEQGLCAVAEAEAGVITPSWARGCSSSSSRGGTRWHRSATLGLLVLSLLLLLMHGSQPVQGWTAEACLR